MDIAYLSDFIMLAETLNFSKAAALRNVSQPALSNHILSLEEEFGIKLFDRTRRKVSLTQEGRLLLNDAQEILHRYEAMHRFNESNLLENHVFTAGGFLENPEVLGLLATRIRNFAAAEGLSVKLLCDYDPVPELEKKLHDKKLDFLVAYENTLETESGPIASSPFYEDPFFVAVSAENPLSSQLSLALEELKHLRFVRLAAPVFNSGWEQVESACERHGFKPETCTVFVDSIYDCAFIDIDPSMCFVIAYGGFSNGATFRARQDVVLIPLEEECFSISLFYNGQDAHPLISRFVEFSKDHAADLQQARSAACLAKH